MTTMEKKAEELMATIQKKADALKVQVLRELGIEALPKQVIVPDWTALVDLVALHGQGAVKDVVESIRFEMNKSER